VGRKTTGYQESPREAGQRVIGHWTASMSALCLTCTADGSMSECYAVRGYRFCQSSAYRWQCSGRLQKGISSIATDSTKLFALAKGFAETQTTLRTRPCDHRWFRRLTALLNNNQTQIQNTPITTVEGKVQNVD